MKGHVLDLRCMNVHNEAKNLSYRYAKLFLAFYLARNYLEAVKLR